MSDVAKEMPRYESTRSVWALRIKSIEQPEEYLSAFAEEGGYWHLIPQEEGYEPIKVSHNWFVKNEPKEGGYYVIDKNGRQYFSSSPFGNYHKRIE